MIPESYGIERVDVSALTGFAGNPRTHSDVQIDQIAASIREFGWTNPILVDAVGTVIAGHGRLAAGWYQLGARSIVLTYKATMWPRLSNGRGHTLGIYCCDSTNY